MYTVNNINVVHVFTLFNVIWIFFNVSKVSGTIKKSSGSVFYQRGHSPARPYIYKCAKACQQSLAFWKWTYKIRIGIWLWLGFCQSNAGNNSGLPACCRGMQVSFWSVLAHFLPVSSYLYFCNNIIYCTMKGQFWVYVFSVTFIFSHSLLLLLIFPKFGYLKKYTQ